MKKVIVSVLVLMFLFVTGITLADQGETERAGAATSGPALNNMANWLTSHFPSWEGRIAPKEEAPPLSPEELGARRKSTGVGMRGIVGHEECE